MKFIIPSAFQPPTQGDRANPVWWQYWFAVFQTLTGQGAIPRLPTYTVAGLPDAAVNARGVIFVSDGTANKRLAVSDGTNWRFPDGNIVS